MRNDRENFNVLKERISRNFIKRGFELVFCESAIEVTDIILSYLKLGDSIGYGGSQTLKELSLLSNLRENGFNFEDRDNPALTRIEKNNIQKKMMSADVFFSSANAISIDGSIVNIDHTGNRVASILYGPDKVFIIVGINKICETENDAVVRAKEIASPLNAKRNCKLYQPPCIETKKCVNCEDSDRICSSTVIINKCTPAKRISLVVVNEVLGY